MTGENAAATLLAEHYRDTFEVTWRMWQQRNRLFLVLLAATTAGSMVSTTSDGPRAVLGDRLVSFLAITDRQRADEFLQSFPFALVHLAFSAVVFYLMFNLNHRTAYVNRLYDYLAALEGEIRAHLALDAKSKAFTREGTFYWRGTSGHAAIGERSARFAYVGVLGVLLVLFVAGQLVSAEGRLFTVVEGIVSLATVVYFGDYAIGAVRTPENARTKRRGRK